MTTEDVGKLYPVAKAVLTPLFRASWKFQLEGLENIPAEGGAILCPNHTSVLDSFFVPAMLPRRVTYVGKAEYMDSWKTRKLFPALGMIPIDRTGGDAAERALATAQRVLEKGELFGIYPEGTRSRDGRLYRGKTGPARLALRAGVPIIPVGIRGARDVMPPDARFPKLRQTVTIRFGQPIDVSRYADRLHDHLVLRQIIDEVMYEIRQLSGQDYVNEYASRKAPAAEPAATEPAATEPVAAEAVTIDLRPDATSSVEPSVSVGAGAERETDTVLDPAGTTATDPDIHEADDPAAVPAAAASGTGNGHGPARGTPRGAADRRSGRRSEEPEQEFAKATRPRSSADVLRNPPRRAHLATDSSG